MKKLALLSLFAALVASPAAHAQTFSVIHTFTGVAGDGADPESGVILGNGVLYGTTSLGGIGGPAYRAGTVYQMTHSGSDWFYTPIFFFPYDGSGGAFPGARVVFGPDGHLYGTTTFGGTGGAGVVFSLTPPLSICKTLSCLWKETVVHNFLGGPVDGATPGSGDLVWDQMGNLYGTTGHGGSKDQGTAFQMNPGTNTYSVIYNFKGAAGNDGSQPNGVILDKSGSLYGTTYTGGVQGFGTVFELSHVNDWTETVLYSFTGVQAFPYAGLVADSAGNLYDATTGDGGGAIFELSPSGDTWTFKVIFTFPGGGGGPSASLTMDAAGNLYGTTYNDGAHLYGNVFKLTNTPNGWVYTSLYDFTHGGDGGEPMSQVTIDADGTLYGTTSEGGNDGCGGIGCGVVWMIKP